MKILIYILGFIVLAIYYLMFFIGYIIMLPFKIYGKITGRYKTFVHKQTSISKAKQFFKDTGKHQYVIEYEKFYNVVGDKFLKNNPGNKKKIIFSTNGS